MTAEKNLSRIRGLTHEDPGMPYASVPVMRGRVLSMPGYELGGFIAMPFGKSTAWVYFVAGIRHKDLNTALESLSQIPGFLAQAFHLIA